MYEIGTIKVTWIYKDNFMVLNSKMFKKNELEKALAFAKGLNVGKDFMIFELMETKNDAYKWKLLPYGDADKFVKSMEYQNSRFLQGLVGLGLILAIYGTYKVFSK